MTTLNMNKLKHKIKKGYSNNLISIIEVLYYKFCKWIDSI